MCYVDGHIPEKEQNASLRESFKRFKRNFTQKRFEIAQDQKQQKQAAKILSDQKKQEKQEKVDQIKQKILGTKQFLKLQENESPTK